MSSTCEGGGARGAGRPRLAPRLLPVAIPKLLPAQTRTRLTPWVDGRVDGRYDSLGTRRALELPGRQAGQRPARDATGEMQCSLIDCRSLQERTGVHVHCGGKRRRAGGGALTRALAASSRNISLASSHLRPLASTHSRPARCRGPSPACAWRLLFVVRPRCCGGSAAHRGDPSLQPQA